MKMYASLAVVAILANPAGQVLLVKKSALKDIDPGLWTLPGGRVEPGEALQDALTREVQEEVSLSIKSYEWVGQDVVEIASGHYFYANHFVCVPETLNVQLEDGLDEFAWVGPADLGRYSFPPNIKKALLRYFSS